MRFALCQMAKTEQNPLVKDFDQRKIDKKKKKKQLKKAFNWSGNVRLGEQNVLFEMIQWALTFITLFASVRI